MKSIIKYLPVFAVVLSAIGLTGCQDDFDAPVVDAPVAKLHANMSIFELKQKYWNDATNYIDTIGIRRDTIYDTDGKTILDISYPTDSEKRRLFDDKEYVTSGRVVSSDEAGNVFKSLIIQDETAAIALSINSYNLYLKYRIGQEIVLDLKGMYIGKYNGLVQLGMPEWYEAGNAWEATFMAPEFFEDHAEPNGWPEPQKIDTLEINSFSDLPSNPDGLCRYQSRIVKFNNVYFQNGGKEQFSEYHSSGVNQNIVDANGNTLPVRTSGYSNFWNKTLPAKNGDLVAILSYYGTTGWQLIMNDYAGCMNFGNPTLAPGAEDNPYTVMQAVEAINNGKMATGWVKGYIVGAVAPEVTEVKGNDDVEWGADVVLDNTLVIGAAPDTKDISQALVISLPADSPLRKYGNLVDNPGNYQKEIIVKGVLGKYMGTYGILDNTGKATEFTIEGVTIDDGSAPAGDGTEAKPYNVAQVIGGASGTDVWVRGYIVGWIDGKTLSEGAKFNGTATANTNILIAGTPDVTAVAEAVPVQLPVGAVRTALNLQDHPENYKKEVWLKGSLEKYFGAAGIKSVSEYKLDGTGTPDTPDTPVDNGTPAGTGTATDPYNVAKALEVAKANGETSKTNVYTVGYVISGSIDTNYGNGTFDICDKADGSSATIKVFRCKDFNNEKFTDANKVKVGDKIVVYAPLINYMGNTPETSYGYLYSINGQTGTSDNPGTPDDPNTPDTPVVTGNSADFNTLNGGKANTMSYATYTTTDGWTAEWALVLGGGTDATNFVSTDTGFLFPCLDGTTARPGRLTSPTISGGIGKLTFNYGFPYNDTKVQFTVNILQGGKVVASDTVLANPATKATVFNYSHDFNIKGDFVVQIVNDLATGTASGNKDRVAIWNLQWTNSK